MSHAENGMQEPTLDYDNFFDPDEYLKRYGLNLNASNRPLLKFLLDFFSTGEPSGELLDLGTGPNIFMMIFASRQYKSIYLSDYAKANLRSLRAWKNREAGAYDWTPLYDYVANEEGLNLNGDGAKVIESRIRSAVRDIYACDVRQDNPLHPLKPRQYDCLVTSLMLECAAATREDYRRFVRNVHGLLKPNGRVLVHGDLNESFHVLGGKRFRVLSLDKEFVKTTFEEAGFVDVQLQAHAFEGGEFVDTDWFDGTAYFHLSAVKKVS